MIAKQEAKVTDVEKHNAEMETAKKRTAAETKTLADKLAKQEQTVTGWRRFHDTSSTLE